MAQGSQRQMPSARAVAAGAAVAAFWLAVWEAASLALAQPLIFPGPVAAAESLLQLVTEPGTWLILLGSGARILGGLALACAVAAVLAAASWRSGVCRRLVAPALSFVKATPVACAVVLLLIWLGSARVSIAAVFLMALPGVYFSLLQGLDEVDGPLAQMMRVHGVRGIRFLLARVWPSVLPFVLSCARSVIGMSWKAGVAAELIGMAQQTVGERIYQAKLLIETSDLFAWTVLVVAMSWACERVLVRLLELSGPVAWRLAVRLHGRGRAGGAGAAGGRGVVGAVGAADADEGADGRGISGGREAAGACKAVDVLRAADGCGVVDDRGADFAVPVHVVAAGRAPWAPALADVALDVPAGGRLCVMGPSGVGKTTLLGFAVADAPAQAAVVFQDARLVEQTSALDNVLLCAPRGVTGVQAAALLRELIPEVDPQAPVTELSGGQRRRVELARALLAPGGLLVLDEPFAGLDAAARDRAARIVLERRRGRTLIVATHDAADAQALSAVTMQLGRAG